MRAMCFSRQHGVQFCCDESEMWSLRVRSNESKGKMDGVFEREKAWKDKKDSPLCVCVILDWVLSREDITYKF